MLQCSPAYEVSSISLLAWLLTTPATPPSPTRPIPEYRVHTVGREKAGVPSTSQVGGLAGRRQSLGPWKRLGLAQAALLT